MTSPLLLVGCWHQWLLRDRLAHVLASGPHDQRPPDQQHCHVGGPVPQWRATVGDLERDATYCDGVELGATPRTDLFGPTLADTDISTADPDANHATEATLRTDATPKIRTPRGSDSTASPGKSRRRAGRLLGPTGTH